MDSDDDDANYCKKCGLLLEEGRAYELGGNRWHVECFTCTSCNSLLDCDTNLLVLGNGSLICNNCSYRCQTCHKKIEDLAILTGDQAYCSSCFCCRNCKKKIDDLKYARTFQGIFCMACHETLLARKKQKSHEKRSHNQQHRHTLHQRESLQNQQRPELPHNNSSGSTHQKPSPVPSYSSKNIREKSLPSIPKEEPAVTPVTSPPVNSGARPRRESETDDSNNGSSTKIHLVDAQTSNGNGYNHSSNDSATLTVTDSYHERNDSDSSHLGILPIKLDDSIKLDVQPPSRPDERASSYFANVTMVQDDDDDEDGSGDSNKSQVKEDIEILASKIEPTSDESTQNGNSLEVPTPPIPRPSSALSSRSHRSFRISNRPGSMFLADSIEKEEDQPSDNESNKSSTASPSDLYHNRSPSPSQLASSPNLEKPGFGSGREDKKKPAPLKLEEDSMDKLIPERSVLRSSSPMRTSSRSPARDDAAVENKPSPDNKQADDSTRLSTPSRQLKKKGSMELKRTASIARSARSSPRSSLPQSPISPAGRQTVSSSSTTTKEDGGGTSMISLPSFQSTAGFLSDDLTPFLSAEHQEDLKRDSMANELVSAKKRIAELERQLSEKDQSTLEEDLLEKRKTIAGLQAQQVVSRKELETRYENGEVNNGGGSSETFTDKLKNEVQQVKDDLMQEISLLIEQRDSLKHEVEDLEKRRDAALKESSVLNVKNTQLADMNNELTKQLIDRFGNSGMYNPLPSHSGSSNHNFTTANTASSSNSNTTTHNVNSTSKLSGSGSMNTLDSYAHSPATIPSSQSGPINNMMGTPQHGFGGGDEPMVTVLEAGQVVDTRKDRQHARRFWKRPGAAVAKGLNKVFANEDSPHQSQHQPQNKEGQHSQQQPNSLTNSVTDLSQESGLGISFPKDNQKSNSNNHNNSNNNNKSRNNWFKGNAETQSVEKSPDSLMGNSIESRVEFEGTTVPVLVTKCIEEVEQRGTDFEGIYRKSGGKSQISQIEEVFEKCQESKYEEALSGDISGVTSALKQYLRYLPVPLITYDCYDDFIKVTTDISRDDLEGRIDKLRKVVQDLPVAHRDTLSVLMKHLGMVTQYHEQNLMTTKNMAVVFAPTIARHTTGEREILDMQPRNEGTQLMIEHSDKIFD